MSELFRDRQYHVPIEKDSEDLVFEDSRALVLFRTGLINTVN
jgi:hypothetical protein